MAINKKKTISLKRGNAISNQLRGIARLITAFILVSILASHALAQTPNINVSSTSGFQGSNVNLNLQFNPGSTGISSLQFDLKFPASLTFISGTPGNATLEAGKFVYSNVITDGLRILIFNANNNFIGAGSLCSIQLQITTQAAVGNIPVTFENMVAADPEANYVIVSSTPGGVTVLPPPDTTPPVISSLTVLGIMENGATVNWNTNESSTSRVEYGTTTAYGSMTILDTSMQTSHVQNLSGLNAGTVYHIRVISMDEAGNVAVSGDFTFKTSESLDTTPPVISSVTASGITENGAIISWTTNEASTSRLEYGTTTAYGSSTNLNTSMQTSHIQALNGLVGETLYHYRVFSMDEEGNLAESTDYTFKTSIPADTTPPEISSVSASGITTEGAKINWTTNETSTSQVEYGTTTNYGHTTALNTSMQSSHTQTLSGLSIDTLYHYRVRSKDAEGNLAVSDNHTFKTLSDTTAPKISSVIVSGQTLAEATITWTTDEASDTQIEYGTTAGYGTLTTLDSSPTTSHVQTLDGLTPDTDYHFRVLSRDKSGNLAKSEDYSFTSMKNASTLIMPMFGEGLVSGNNQLYSGFAIMNMDSIPATVQFTAFDEGGNVISGDTLTNPVVRSLNPGEQVAIVDVEIFGDSLAHIHPYGWIELASTTDQLQGFFMIFDEQIRLVDAVHLVSEPLKDFVFTDIESEGRTRINLINRNTQNCGLTMDLVKENGDVRSSVAYTVMGHSALIADLYTDIFPGITPQTTDYIRISADNTIVPFQMMQEGTGDVSIGYGQELSTASTRVFVPNYTNNKNSMTALTIVNLDSTAGNAQVRLVGRDGVQIGATRDTPIFASGKLTVDSQDFFLDPVYAEAMTTEVSSNTKKQPGKPGKGNPSPSSPEIDGYVEIVSDGIRLVGNASYRGYRNQSFIATLPLVSELSENVVFHHIASDDLYYTDIAIVNPGITDATVTLELYNDNGVLVDTSKVSVPAGQQLRHSLSEYFGALKTASQIGGHVILSSSLPVATYSLFGTNNRSALSALPGHKIK